MAVDQHRRKQRHEFVRSPQEMVLHKRIRTMDVKYSRYGYRGVHVMWLRDRLAMNRKWVLHRNCHKQKSSPWSLHARGQYPNHVWFIDFQLAETTD